MPLHHSLWMRLVQDIKQCIKILIPHSVVYCLRRWRHSPSFLTVSVTSRWLLVCTLLLGLPSLAVSGAIWLVSCVCILKYTIIENVLAIPPLIFHLMNSDCCMVRNIPVVLAINFIRMHLWIFLPYSYAYSYILLWILLCIFVYSRWLEASI